MNTLPKQLVSAALALLLAPTAHADWAYSRWGMTPEQVVAASSGEAELINQNNREKVNRRLARARYVDGPQSYWATFLFDGRRPKLIAVQLDVIYQRYNSAVADCGAIRQGLVDRHGEGESVSQPPVIAAALGNERRWMDANSGDRISMFTKQSATLTIQATPGSPEERQLSEQYSCWLLVKPGGRPRT